MTLPTVRFRVDFTTECSVGIGKIELLEAIVRTGSLSQAAREMAMSYRRAWLLVNSLNAEFDTPVICTSVGGSGGGGASLTEFGQEVVRTYRGLEAKIGELAAVQLRGIARRAVEERQHEGATGPRRQRIARGRR